MDFLTLDFKGIMIAFALAALLLFFGKGIYVAGGLFIAMMLEFLLFSAITTWIGKPLKKRLNLYESSRGYKNVVANGAGPLLFALLFYLSNSPLMRYVAIIGFLAAIAAITADKFSSEIGVLDGTPVMITTLKHVKKGTSGGITAIGVAAGAFGALLVSVSSLAYPGFLAYGPLFSPFVVLASCTAAGIIGTLADSVIGYYETNGIGNKHTTNFIAAVVGAIAGIIVYFLLL